MMERDGRVIEYEVEFKRKDGTTIPILLTGHARYDHQGKALAKGVDIAGRMIRRIHEEKMCDGVHIMAIGKEETVPDIMAAAGLI
jgi:methylenetetrahydrofolate reductase (NADPH)